MLVKFHQITWQEVKKLSKSGIVGPHVGIESLLLIKGKKPIWLASSIYEANNFLRSVGNKKFCKRKIYNYEKKYMDCYAVFLINKPNNFIKLQKAVSLIDYSKRSFAANLSGHIAVGRALGYTEPDIAKFIINGITFKEFKKWQKNYENELAV